MAIQATDGGTVSETDAADAVVTAPICTLAGQATVSQQLLDQSPINFDSVLFRDLANAQAQQVDLQVLSGTGSNQQVKGIRNAAGTISITYTDTAPTVGGSGGFYTKINDGILRVHTQRYSAPTVIVMRPRRWAWVLAASDTTNRPLVVPNGQAFNQPGTFVDGRLAAGYRHPGRCSGHHGPEYPHYPGRRQ